MWFAAPSSPNADGAPSAAAAGSASCTAKRAGSRKIARSVRAVCGGSIARCGMARRLATVMWMRPSPPSVAGVTVAAFAVHMALALEARARRCGASRAAAATASRSLPPKPSARSVGTCGRSCGGIQPCRTPIRASASAFARPCSAASRGRETAPRLAALATFPGDSPA